MSVMILHCKNVNAIVASFDTITNEAMHIIQENKAIHF